MTPLSAGAGRASRAVLLVTGLATAMPSPTAAQTPARVAVTSIDLNNYFNAAPDTSLASRLQRLAAGLRRVLASACGYEVVALDPASEATAHATLGYFYAHPDVAAGLAGRAGAEWVVIPRVNRASPWVADLQAHVVRVRDTLLASNRIVEMKGLELDAGLADRLIPRGAAWMADQVSQVIERAADPGGAPRRRCPP